MTNDRPQPGYKQTEVGVIPEDWDVDSLANLTQSKRPISYGIVQTGRQVSGGVACIRVVDIVNGRVNDDDLITTSQEISNSYKRTVLNIGDLIIALRGKIGELAVVQKELEGANLTRGVALIALQEKYSSHFYQQYLSSSDSKIRLQNSLNGSALQELPIATLRSFPVAIPPLPEQRSISQALSDVDRLIAALEKAIDKKRALKTATMQQLLTGKKRLPGFGEGKGYQQTEVGVIPEDWEVSCLDSVTKLSSGTTPSRAQEDRYYRNGQYHWVKTTDLNNSRITTTEEKVTKAALDETCLQIYSPGTVLVAMYGGFNQIGRTGLICIPAAVNQALVAIQVKPNKLNPAYLLATLNYRVEYWKSVASSSRKDPNITSQDVRDFALPLPKTEEQSAIATVLSDMDAEIAALETRLAKTQSIKQGMMQQLLTGKVRLKIEVSMNAGREDD